MLKVVVKVVEVTVFADDDEEDVGGVVVGDGRDQDHHL